MPKVLRICAIARGFIFIFDKTHQLKKSAGDNSFNFRRRAAYEKVLLAMRSGNTRRNLTRP
jgi:hypothetical protein